VIEQITLDLTVTYLSEGGIQSPSPLAAAEGLYCEYMHQVT